MDPNTRQAKRAPVTLKIKFKSATLDQFIERYAADVSPGGIFIRTKEPLPVGTQMRFEFQLRDATPLITGDGTVVWTRENDPARPNAAPGMGVRFDRLGDGSQPILDRILAEKAKHPTPSSGTTEPPPNKNFMDAPTRVAPSPLAVTAELAKPKLGQMAPSKSGFADERTDTTPLPRPMPFHSDADEFPEETFEEATKVRALDELVAATAASEAAAEARPEPKAPRPSEKKLAPPAPAPAEPSPADTTAPVVRAVPVPETPPAPTPAVAAAAAPVAAAAAAAPRLVDEPAIAAAKTAAAAAKPAAARPTATATAAPAEPTAIPGTSSKGASAVIIGLLAAALVAAAVWFFVLRGKAEKKNEPAPPPPTASGQSGSQVAVVAVDAMQPDAPPAEVAIDAAAAPVETAPLVVKAAVAGATVTVVETGASGPAPFTADLEVGKPFTIKVSAPGFQDAELKVTGGDKTATAKLEGLPRLIHVTSTPAGATIAVDGVETNKVTPADVTLTKAQAAKAGGVRVYLRKRGYQPWSTVIKPDQFAAEGDQLAATADASMDVAKTGGGSGSGSDAGSGSGSGSSAGSGSGSGSAAGSGSGSAAGSGSGSGSAAGSGSGSAAGSGSGSGSAAGSGSGSAAGSGSGSAKPPTGSGSAKPPTGSGSGSGSGSATPGSGSTGPTPDWAGSGTP